MLFLHENRNEVEDSRLKYIQSYELVVKDFEEVREYKPSASVYLPELINASSEIDLDKTTHISIVSEKNDLEGLLALEAAAVQVDLIMLQAPTDYSGTSFYFKGEPVKRTHKFFKSQVLHWLYNRLIIAHNLLEEHGVCVVQVSDSFMCEVKLVMDDIFGRNNYITTHIVETTKSAYAKKGVLNQHQYVLVYARDGELCLKRNGYIKQNKAYFGVPKKVFSQGLKGSDVGNKGRKFGQGDSSFDLVSLIRSQKRRENDPNYYPIYYMPALQLDKDGIDWKPILNIESTGRKGEIALYPEQNSGKECVWNVTSKTFLCRYEKDMYIVKSVNGRYKLFYKVSDDEKDGVVVEPAKSMITGISNLSTSVWLKDILNIDDTCTGFHPSLVQYLAEAYSKEGDSLLTINDRDWSVYASVIANKIERTLYNIVPPSAKDYKDIIPCINTNHAHQYLVFKPKPSKCESMMDLIQSQAEIQNSLLQLNVGPTMILKKCKEYSLHETSNFDIEVLLYKRYDIALYEKIAKEVEYYKTERTGRVYFYYVGDSEFCLGENLVKDAIFLNRLSLYWNKYKAMEKRLI